jgi:hypothetical protein
MIILRAATFGFSLDDASYYGWRWCAHVGPWCFFFGPTIPQAPKPGGAVERRTGGGKASDALRIFARTLAGDADRELPGNLS